MRRILIGILGLSTLITAVVAISNPSVQVFSSFNEVWAVVSEAPNFPSDHNKFDVIQEELALYGTKENPSLPQFSSKKEVAIAVATFAMRAAARLTIRDKADYRDYFKKQVHANGICFKGSWEMTEDSPYTGLFKNGTVAPIIGRFSAASPQTTNDQNRSFGLAGKIFPTNDLNEEVATANFFTVDNLNGTAVNQALDVIYSNEPVLDLSGSKNPFASDFNPIKVLDAIFGAADVNPNIRQVYPIAEAGELADAATKAPVWMRIRLQNQTDQDGISQPDFRSELLAYENGLTLSVEVSDVTKDASLDLENQKEWKKLGVIKIEEMVTAFGCDRRLHFAHPKFKVLDN